jgi:thioredoxin-dependent peroxiredoxin
MKISRSNVTRVSTYFLLALALCLASYRIVRAADDMPAVGVAAPDFTLNSQEGTPVNLHDYRGKWVVLYFYPKDMSPGCTIEAHAFQSDLDKYQKMNTVILGVSVDTVDSHKAFCAKDSLNFTLLADVNHDISAKYGSVMTFGTNTVAARNTFLINPKGEIVKEFVKVSPATHSADVLAALDELQKGGTK